MIILKDGIYRDYFSDLLLVEGLALREEQIRAVAVKGWTVVGEYVNIIREELIGKLTRYIIHIYIQF